MTARQGVRASTGVAGAWPVTLLSALIPFSVLEGSARASTISWIYELSVRGTVVGTPTGGGGLTTVTVPTGTPMTIAVSFDSATPNSCANPATQGGVYPIAGDTANTGAITFLGYQYSTFGGIEVGSGPCNSSGVFSGLRLFVNTASQIAPVGTLVQWSNIPGIGAMFINGPTAPAPGALPTTLPSNPFSTSGSIFSSQTVQLVIESARITEVPAAIPEPISALLVGTGLIGLARRGRLRLRRRL